MLRAFDSPGLAGLVAGLALALGGCGDSGGAGGGGNDASQTAGEGGGFDGAHGGSPDSTVDGAWPEGGGPSDDGGPDGGAPGDVTSGGDSIADDGGSGDATTEGGCTPIGAGSFSCAASTCNGSTSFCQVGMVNKTCKPLPVQCQCAETLDCACLLANVQNPCGIGPLKCYPMDDGGVYWIEAIDCP
jgi:hypothetical protein